MALSKEYQLFYDFSVELLKETVSRSNLFTFFKDPSFESKEILSVSLDYSSNLIEWEFASWHFRKDLEFYFENNTAIGQYRYQILKPNPSLFYSRGNLPRSSYQNTLNRINDNNFPTIINDWGGIGIDGTTFNLNFSNGLEYNWWCDLPNSFLTLETTLMEINDNLELGRKLAIQKLI